MNFGCWTDMHRFRIMHDLGRFSVNSAILRPRINTVNHRILIKFHVHQSSAYYLGNHVGWKAKFPKS